MKRTVKDLINELYSYNMDAEINVVVEGSPRDFEILFGTNEGVTKRTCDIVSLCVDCDEENLK